MAANGGVSPQGLHTAQTAIAYAAEQHADQWRSADGAPFIVHPLEVAHLLHQVGAPDHVVAAGVLHDVIEKGRADAEDLRARFGRSIAKLVLAVSEDPRIRSYARRKAALRDQAASAGDEALMIYAADKLSKVRELNLEGGRTSDRRASRSPVPDPRLEHYRRSLRLLEDRLPGSPLVRELRAELQRTPRMTDRASAMATLGITWVNRDRRPGHGPPLT